MYILFLTHFEICRLVKSFTSSKEACFAPSLLNDRVGKLELRNISRVSNIESDNSQNVGLEAYNNISDGIFLNFTTPSIKVSLG